MAKTLSHILIAISGLGLLVSCAPKPKDDIKVQAESAVGAAAQAPKSMAYSSGYQIPFAKFECKNNSNTQIEFKIIAANKYISQSGQSGQYSVLNDDLIYFQSSYLKGFFGQVKNQKNIRLFKSQNQTNLSFDCFAK